MAPCTLLRLAPAYVEHLFSFFTIAPSHRARWYTIGIPKAYARSDRFPLHPALRGPPRCCRLWPVAEVRPCPLSRGCWWKSRLILLSSSFVAVDPNQTLRFWDLA